MSDLVRFVLAVSSIAVLVVALTHLSVWVEGRETENEKEQDRRREHEKRRRASNHQQSIASAIATRLEAIDDELYAGGKQQQRHERKRSLLEIIAVVAAIAAASLAFWSAFIFQGQLEEMRAEQRAWIKVAIIEPFVRKDKLVPDGFRFHGTDFPAFLPFHIVLKNVGRSPALNVRVRIFPIMENTEGPVDLLNREDSECRRLDTAYPAGPIKVDNTNFFPVIFPGDEETDDSETLGLLPKIMEQFSSPGGDGERLLSLWIAGCVRYTLTQGGEPHQTSFAYRAWHEVQAGIPGGIAADYTFAIGKDVPADKIRLDPRPMAAGTTN